MQVAVGRELVAPDSLEQLALRPGSGVRASGVLDLSQHGQLALFAESVQLLSLPTEPGILLSALRQRSAGALDTAAAAAALGCSVAALEEAGAAFEGGGASLRSSAAQTDGLLEERRFSAALEAALRGGRREKCASRRGAPPPRPAELTALGRLLAAPGGAVGVEPVQSWGLAPPSALVGEVEEEELLEGAAAGPWVLGGSAAASAERAARLLYVHEKVEPALRWALLQVEELIEKRPGARALLDVGCGRGDIALSLARRHPKLHVIGLDSNATALATARARAEAAGLVNVRFVRLEADRLHLQLAGGGRSGELQPLLEEVDVVVALRACGALADAALSLASARAASALVWPCCYGKYQEFCPADAAWGLPEDESAWLCQQADGGDECELAAPAQRAIGGLRLAAAARRRPTARCGLRCAPPETAAQSTALWVEDGGV